MGLLQFIRNLATRYVKNNPKGAGRNRAQASKRKKKKGLHYHRFLSVVPPRGIRLYGDVKIKVNGRHR